MQVIIDIPEEEYELCKSQYDTECLDVLMIAVKYGTPLPKGHGKLKDVDKIEALLDLDKADNEIAKALKNIIDSVPTIIEADKEADKSEEKEQSWER